MKRADQKNGYPHDFGKLLLLGLDGCWFDPDGLQVKYYDYNGIPLPLCRRLSRCDGMCDAL